MNKLLPVLFCVLFLTHTCLRAQRICGQEVLKAAIIAKHPEAKDMMERQRQSLQAMADKYKRQHTGKPAQKMTSSPSPVPVVFHIIVDSAQFAELGGTDGISRRCDSQIVVLNRDFNRQNVDSSLILSGFKPFYTSVGIQFGLAHTDPGGYTTPGYEIKIISADGFNGADSSYTSAKHASSNGLDSWDVTRYLNIWCINFLDFSGLIGLTVPRSFVDSGWYAPEDNGVCLTYNVFGARSSSADNYPAHFDEGRSCTHEVGHFFEIWHPWGDDGGLCPGSGGTDDGIADTPPEADNASGSPTGPVFDACTPAGNGIMWMNYMDYCNDDAVHMFTIDQAAVMAAQVAPGGESYNLTQNPGLLSASNANAAANRLNVFPNPSTGILNVSYNDSNNKLLELSVMNIIGQEVKHINTSTQQKDFYSIDLSAMSKGIYFVKCTFASGNITKKIVLR